MTRALLFSLVLGVAACAASPSDDTASSQTEFALGMDLSCNAAEAQVCPAGGCQGQAPETNQLPISLFVPARGGEGRFCIATGCEDAEIEPTLTRALGWTARVTTNDRTSMAADLEISRDMTSFRLRDHSADGISTWEGTCQAAGS